jgi:starch phosphorylase
MFLADYDMLLTEHMVQGVDVWINTPRRPWEASGTSGMKVLVNGGLNISELDGWWAEAYVPGVGWALGDGREHGEDPGWDAAEAEALYALLEEVVVPEFYDREDGIPKKWVARMRASMARLTPQFSANRMVREYTERYYMPAAARYDHRVANNGATGREIAEWRRSLARNWGSLRFGDVKVDTRAGLHCIDVEVHYGDLDPDAVRVEIYADGVAGGAAVRQPMARALVVSDGLVYRAEVPGSRAAADYTVRVIPQHPDVAVPLEEARVLWQR